MESVSDAAPRALEGIRVCDLTGQLAGAGATRYLAALGADVIRVEDPVRQGRWDILRGAPPYRDDRRGVDVGGAFNNHNVGKRGITIDLRQAEGRELLTELIAVSDVLTENFSAGVMDRLGFTPDEVKRINPQIVYVSQCGFGHSGPYRDFKTWGPVVQAFCGLAALSGLPGEPPAGWGMSLMDHVGADFMTIAVLAALVQREVTGLGQWIDVACTEAGVTMLGPALLDWTVNGHDTPIGELHSNHSVSPAMVPHNVYGTCEDDTWVALACRDDHEWGALSDLTGVPDDGLTAATLSERLASQDVIDEHISAWVSTRSAHEVVKSLRSIGVPVALVARPSDRIRDDDDLREWNLWPSVTHPILGTVDVDGLPVHFDVTDWDIFRPAPCLGEHTDEVLSSVLGKSRAEIESLRGRKVI